MCGMSEDTVLSSEMEMAEVDSEKSALNFSISRLLSGEAEKPIIGKQRHSKSKGSNNNGSTGTINNNNYQRQLSNKKQYHHTVHHHGSQQQSESMRNHNNHLSSIHHQGEGRSSNNHNSSSSNSRHQQQQQCNNKSDRASPKDDDNNGGERDSDCSETLDPSHHSDDSEVEMDDCGDEVTGGRRTGSVVSKYDDQLDNDQSDQHNHDDGESNRRKRMRSGSSHNSRGDQDCGTTNSNRSTPESPQQHSYHHHHQLHQLSQQHESHLTSPTSSAGYNHGSLEGLSGAGGPHGPNPFPMLGYSSIFLPNFPCSLTSPANQVIRVPAHRPMSNFQLFGQSGLGPHNPMDLNAAPLFSTFDPRSSLLLKDRLNGKKQLTFLSIISSVYYIQVVYKEHSLEKK